LKSWDIWTWEGHPVVVVSNQRRIERKHKVVVLKCQTLYSGDPPAGEFEATLGQEDGLDRLTVCTCDLLFTAHKSEISQKRGAVSYERQRDISRKMIQGLAIAGL
jgi:mRNA-degrading endonuclease toxin of MazEF toxin-antitoxin module